MALNLPLLALRTFVTVATYGSIKSAASVLNITSGAVSQQIRLLEARVGQPLFIRGRHGMDLTEIGRKIYPALLQAFEQIEAVSQTLSQEITQQTVTISTMPTLASSWLVPRLGAFNRRYPHIEVRVEATPSLVDFRSNRVDIALRHGLGNYPGLSVTRFMTPVYLPVASPQLITQDLPLSDPKDCLHYPLLQDSDRADWTLWFEAQGIEDARAARGSSFDDDLLISAAIAGQGLALVPDFYARKEIAAGRLVQVSDTPWPTAFAYYIVHPYEATNKPAVATFIAWLLKEAADGTNVLFASAG